MELRNRDGTPVDPVPFLVTTAAAFLVTYSFAPLYVLELGFREPAAVALTTVAFLALAAGSYHQLVWTVDPVAHEEVPASRRLLRLVYGVVAVALLMLALSIPLVVQ